jgi:PhnB protein
MSEDIERIRRLRADDVQPDDPADPTVFIRHKEQLMAAITNRVPDPTTYARMPDIYPRLAYNDERAALEYLQRVFSLPEIREARTDFGDHMLAWLRTGTGVVMIGRANEEVHRISSPETIGHTTVQMMVYVPNIDSHYAHAVAEGADVTMPLEDAFYGERRYEATDLEGHRWHFAERFADIQARGGVVADNPAGGLPGESAEPA